ncbi:3-hydroxybutyryl-CoA dehydrogenase [Acinetobacter sp. ANC 3832]|uniref:3-hydroxybutyryl-CoA dehydrogenase n=1 Tax=Acinetobacter sp. ANC 3832 TaxID=1977874 RepID=UPI000A34BAD1|nr:3-hydroxybutyryl-CoA dehydrogenase [Acinetobacter sp. ANC 3832]OTG88996.1 3-hydroxybutyryl-CoA dehydrogenase [Acinetobacter sp. ANC 3832]
MSNIQHTAVVGAGRMGKAIAIAFAYAGLQVKLIDAKERSCEDFVQYQQQVEQDITQELLLLSQIQLIQTAQISSIQANIEVLSKSTSIQYLNQCDLVLEGVPEKIQVKQDIFTWLDQHVASDCIVASTTSTFLVTDIAKMLSHPERVVNAHWLNPAYLMPLVELSRSEQTSDKNVLALKSFLTSIGKVAVVCNAKAGYIVPRIQALAMNEAARMVEEGVASAEDIDIAIRTGFGLRFSVLGLLEFIDWGGGDILYYASQYLERELGERYSTPDIIKENMQNGRNGLREQQGFYQYEGVDIPAYKKQVLQTFLNRIETSGLKPKLNIVSSIV